MAVFSLRDLDSVCMSTIDQWLYFAKVLEQRHVDVSKTLSGKILCAVFGQESSRTYLNSVSSFIRMGGTVLPLNLSNTRFGSVWSEPVQDFACLLNSCCDQIICRDSTVNSVNQLAELLKVPFINAGNGTGAGSEHPMQALIDLYTIRQNFGSSKLEILMMGGTHIRSTRSQIKLFLREGHSLTIMSPTSPVENNDIEKLIEAECMIYQKKKHDWSKFDLIYHNGMDEDPNAELSDEYILTNSRVIQNSFTGKIMHSLPRRKEMSVCLDKTDFNLYFQQMENSKWLFQSVYHHMHTAKEGHAYAA